ncbi:MAG: hypothetical protein LUF04_10180 [Bacteroides sp.]|nr:hypothetical protein [Bacteroides sp.]
MKKRIVYMTALCILTLMTACSVKEGFIDKDCPELGPGPGTGTDTESLRIVFDWSEATQQHPDELIRIDIAATDGTETSLQSGPEGTTAELDAGMYRVTGYERAENVTVADEIVTVATCDDGSAEDPGTFTGGAVQAEVKQDVDNQVITIPMRYQTRMLIIRIRFTGEGVPELVESDGYVDGVTFSRPINEGFAPLDGQPRHAALTSGTVDYTFAPGADDWYVGSRNLLGVDGDATQRLCVVLYFADGFSRELHMDVTEEMYEFHTYNVEEPWVISITLSLGTSFDIVLEDWNSGPSSVIIAE